MTKDNVVTQYGNQSYGGKSLTIPDSGDKLILYDTDNTLLLTCPHYDMAKNKATGCVLEKGKTLDNVVTTAMTYADAAQQMDSKLIEKIMEECSKTTKPKKTYSSYGGTQN